jgi:ribose-phosphate pyrophosphokinase
MELLICIDSLKRASAKEIIVVLTYYAYARQDRKVSGREPITAKLLANLIETAGANRIICVDIHSEQIQGFFNVPFDSVSFLPVLLYEIINKVKTKNLAIVSPDYGGVKRARNLAKILNCDLAILNKYRPKPNVAEITNILGDVRNKNCLIVDDMIDTAGTITSACKVIKQNGAKSISIAAIHGVLSTIAIERIKKCFDTKIIDNLFLTNTIPYVYNTGLKKITIIDISKFLADVISVICSNDDSLSTLLNNYVKKINEKKTNN